jgi:hypothetical protein
MHSKSKYDVLVFFIPGAILRPPAVLTPWQGLGPTQEPAIAVWFPREVTMETLTGPIFYLLVAWGILTAIFLVLLIWRSLLESHEDDQIFIEASGDRMAKEQRDLVQKINTLSRPIMASGVAAGGLLLFIAGFWLYQGLKNF